MEATAPHNCQGACGLSRGRARSGSGSSSGNSTRGRPSCRRVERAAIVQRTSGAAASRSTAEAAKAKEDPAPAPAASASQLHLRSSTGTSRRRRHHEGPKPSGGAALVNSNCPAGVLRAIARLQSARRAPRPAPIPAPNPASLGVLPPLPRGPSRTVLPISGTALPCPSCTNSRAFPLHQFRTPGAGQFEIWNRRGNSDHCALLRYLASNNVS